ncbi:hypothetical protein K2173_022912 [Erythroxylum novogranatense]|uniref:RNA polymerase Rpb7-like N-terminal domain-containing protein n=1 Tax=Erythroxylum novogranatense TaxID=1862640 RepID=A0AAV8T979_9ROSI|nr:hypothetical protein K2173_022912 [Erythroxylum novogranatense]
MVIANLGLCVSVYDIRNIDGGFIFPKDGASTYTYHLGFSMIFFIPSHLLPHQSHYVPDPKKRYDLRNL